MRHWRIFFIVILAFAHPRVLSIPRAPDKPRDDKSKERTKFPSGGGGRRPGWS